MEEQSRFWWLWHNRLFEETPLTGYAFINSAKKVIEVVFWYGIILMFTLFTVNNVYSLITRYQSRPTKTDVVITSNALNATIQNFTLKLTLPMSEMRESTVYWRDWDLPLTCNQDFFTHLFTRAPEFATQCLPLYMYQLLEGYDNETAAFLLEQYTVPMGSQKDGRQCPASTQALDADLGLIVETEEVLKELEATYSNTLEPIWIKLRDYVEGSYKSNVMNAYMEFQSSYTWGQKESGLYFAPFLLLNAMSDDSIKKRFPFLKLFNGEKFHEARNLSPRESFERVSRRPLNIAPLKTPAELEEAKIFLRKWTTEFKDRKQDTDPLAEKLGFDFHQEFGDAFELEYHIEVPDNVNQFSVDIYPPKQLINALFVLSDFDKTLWELKRMYPYPVSKEANFLYELLACRAKDWNEVDLETPITNAEGYFLTDYLFEEPRLKMIDHYLYPVIDHYKLFSQLQVHTSGGHITLEPFTSYTINLLPIGRIVSETENCNSMDVTECLDSCQGNHTLRNCECYPWNLYYLYSKTNLGWRDSDNTHFMVHRGLEEQKNECLYECEASLAHPCDHYIYRPEVISKTSTLKYFGLENKEDHTIYRYPLNNKVKFFSLNIGVQQVFTFTKTMEAYELGFTQFISEFGGLVDFWLGVNVIGIIHAIIYLLKQCCHCGRDHKTGQTPRRLFGYGKTHPGPEKYMDQETEKPPERNGETNKDVLEQMSKFQIELAKTQQRNAQLEQNNQKLVQNIRTIEERCNRLERRGKQV